MTIEAVILGVDDLEDIRSLPHVFDVKYEEQRLVVRCTGAKHNLIHILSCLQEKGYPLRQSILGAADTQRRVP